MILTENIHLNPSELYDVEGVIMDKLNEKCKSYCSQRLGYITALNGLEEIHSNKINNIGDKIIYKVSYNVDCFKPEMGDEFDATVVNIFKDGIILVYNEMKIFVPKFFFESVNIPFDNNTYLNIQVGDLLSVIITQIKYEANNFICIADLKV